MIKIEIQVMPQKYTFILTPIFIIIRLLFNGRFGFFQFNDELIKLVERQFHEHFFVQFLPFSVLLHDETQLHKIVSSSRWIELIHTCDSYFPVKLFHVSQHFIIHSQSKIGQNLILFFEHNGGDQSHLSLHVTYVTFKLLNEYRMKKLLDMN